MMVRILFAILLFSVAIPLAGTAWCLAKISDWLAHAAETVNAE